MPVPERTGTDKNGQNRGKNREKSDKSGQGISICLYLQKSLTQDIKIPPVRSLVADLTILTASALSASCVVLCRGRHRLQSCVKGDSVPFIGLFMRLRKGDSLPLYRVLLALLWGSPRSVRVGDSRPFYRGGSIPFMWHLRMAWWQAAVRC